jgi:hypothetical protein
MTAKTGTSLLFSIPAILSFCAHLYLYSGIIVLTMLSSVAYHKMKERRLYWPDLLSSVILMGFNFVFLIRARLSLIFWLILIGMVVLSFYFWIRAHKKQYSLNHSLWHVSSVLITTYAVLMYQISTATEI